MAAIFATLHVLVTLLVASSDADEPCSSKSLASCDNYVDYRKGGFNGWPPVILSAPHDGFLIPGFIPDRDAGCWMETLKRCEWTHTCGTKNFTVCKATTDADVYTRELILELRDNLCALFGGVCPAAIVNNLQRIKFDANRDEPEASFGVYEAQSAFLSYNLYIEDAKDIIHRYQRAGLFIDIHGHGHRIQRAELGYLVRGSNLDSDENLLPENTSINSLASRQSAVDFDNLLRGNASFGALLEYYGFSAVPSPTSRGPGPGNPYFNGGYLTRRHGSRDRGTIDAIQIESARSFREPGSRGRYVHALACAIHDFVCTYYVSSPQVVESQFTPGCGAEYRRLCSGQSHVSYNFCIVSVSVILHLAVFWC